MAVVATVVVVAVLLVSVAALALIVRGAMRHGTEAGSSATPRVPRSLLLALSLAFGFVVVLYLALRIGGAV
jgi:hypothetical protein